MSDVKTNPDAAKIKASPLAHGRYAAVASVLAEIPECSLEVAERVLREAGSTPIVAKGM